MKESSPQRSYPPKAQQKTKTPTKKIITKSPKESTPPKTIPPKSNLETTAVVSSLNSKEKPIPKNNKEKEKEKVQSTILQEKTQTNTEDPFQEKFDTLFPEIKLNRPQHNNADSNSNSTFLYPSSNARNT
jgi:hypothetical protein